MRYCFLRFPEGKFKAVTLSYDDGVRADLRFAEVLNKYNIKGTFNINSGFMGVDGRLTADEIKTAILNTGHEVAVHGENHIAPGIGRPNVAIADILNCRLTLEKQFGRIIRGMAYPDSGIRAMHNSNSWAEIRQYIKDLGIVYSRTLGGDNDGFMLPEDFLAWMPTAHHRNPKLKEYMQKFLALKEEDFRSASRFPRLFYLWGHSYEFDRDDNWDVIEDFCAQMSGRGDIWYATNIEICEYVQAYQSLVTSGDGRMVYNPTLKTIWMDVDGNLVCIGSGETAVLE